jgi:hypothetical protein
MLILELVSLVLCVIVQLELLLILGFMILSLLVFLEVLLLTSLLGFFFSNYNVSIVFAVKKKTINLVLGVGVGFMD